MKPPGCRVLMQPWMLFSPTRPHIIFLPRLSSLHTCFLRAHAFSRFLSRSQVINFTSFSGLSAALLSQAWTAPRKLARVRPKRIRRKFFFILFSFLSPNFSCCCCDTFHLNLKANCAKFPPVAWKRIANADDNWHFLANFKIVFFDMQSHAK